MCLGLVGPTMYRGRVRAAFFRQNMSTYKNRVHQEFEGEMAERSKALV